MLLNSALISLFLSTPSARRATGAAQCEEVSGCISIHALREEGDRRAPRRQQPGAISIHALREEGDQVQSGRPLEHRLISIHALREEGDPRSIMRLQVRYNFYPRPPRGGRLYAQ